MRASWPPGRGSRPGQRPTGTAGPGATNVGAEAPTVRVRFYSAGLRPSSCYRSCKPGNPGAKDEQQTKKGIGELQRMHANFVLNNTPLAKLFTASPRAGRPSLTTCSGRAEVLEWANHAERVRMYRVTKKWFPNTPISV